MVFAAGEFGAVTGRREPDTALFVAADPEAGALAVLAEVEGAEGALARAAAELAGAAAGVAAFVPGTPVVVPFRGGGVAAGEVGGWGLFGVALLERKEASAPGLGAPAAPAGAGAAAVPGAWASKLPLVRRETAARTKVKRD